MHFSCVSQKLPGIYIKSFLINFSIPFESGLLVWDTLPPYQSSYEIFTPNSDVIHYSHDIPIQNSQLSNVEFSYKHFSLGGNPPTGWGPKGGGLPRKGAGWHTSVFQCYESRWAICDELFEDTADYRWAIILWTQDREESLWLVQPGINHAMIFFFLLSPVKQSVF